MRIALVTSEFVTEQSFAGGLANYTYRAARMLQAFGHEPVVITCSAESGHIKHDGIDVHRVRVKGNGKWFVPRWIAKLNALTSGKYVVLLYCYWQSKALNKTLVSLHRLQKFDCVHYAHLEGVGYCKPKALPAVVRLSSATRLCQELGGYGMSDQAIRQQEYLEKRALQKADAVFGPSKQIADYVRTIIHREIHIIETPFVYDVDRLDESVFRQHYADKKYLLFFGSVGLIKGVGTIAACIHEVLRRHPQLHFGFVGKRLAGQDGGDVMEQVWQQAGEHKDRVLWHDAVRHAQLYPIIEHAHTVVLPSRIDNFPNACIEAMAHGKVVIGTKGNGFEQLIEPGKSGLLCQADNPEDLLRTIELALLLSTEEQAAIGEHAKRRVGRLAPESVGRQLVELYETVIRSGGAHRGGASNER